jgi:DNA-binding HxlR family transcriptional regulator
VEYSLTEKGQALIPIIEAMRAYGRDWLRGDAEGVATLLTDEQPAPALA